MEDKGKGIGNKMFHEKKRGSFRETTSLILLTKVRNKEKITHLNDVNHDENGTIYFYPLSKLPSSNILGENRKLVKWLLVLCMHV